MFDVGFWEVTLIGVVALLVVGPERLPALARTVGRYVGKARRYADHIRREIEREVPTREIREAINNPSSELDDIKSSLGDAKSALTDASNEVQREANKLNENVRADDASATETVTETAAPEISDTNSGDDEHSPPQTLGERALSSLSSGGGVVAESTATDSQAAGPESTAMDSQNIEAADPAEAGRKPASEPQ